MSMVVWVMMGIAIWHFAVFVPDRFWGGIVGALMIFGGETLRDFAFALLVGIASGAYSSIFIASPVLTLWKEREPVYVRRRKVVAGDHGGKVPAFDSGVLGDRVTAPAGTPAAPGAVAAPRRPRPGRVTPATAGGPAPSAPPVPAPEPQPAPDAPAPLQANGHGDGTSSASGSSTSGSRQADIKRSAKNKARKKHGRR